MSEKAIVMFFVALLIRCVFHWYFPDLANEHYEYKDGRSYVELSKALTIEPVIKHGVNYNSWYLKCPAYVLFLKVIQRNIYVNIFVASIGVYLLCLMSLRAGVMFALYPPHIYYSVLFFKESLLLTLIIFILYVFRYRHWAWSFIWILIIMVPFQSVGILVDTAYVKVKYLQNFWNLWKPVFVVPSVHWIGWNYILAVPYSVLIILWIRRGKICSIQLAMFIVLSVVYTLVFGSSRYREPFMITLFLWTGND